MIKKEITCTVCPVGCLITVTGDQTSVHSLTGNQCQRGIPFATDEFIQPKRILTTTINIEGHRNERIAVRSTAPIPKDLLFDAISITKQVRLKAPIKHGQMVVENILDTGVDIVVTGY